MYHSLSFRDAYYCRDVNHFELFSVGRNRNTIHIFVKKEIMNSYYNFNSNLMYRIFITNFLF